jgi:hypothetical protein
MTMFGFRVRELIGGIEWWKRDGYKTESLSHATQADAGDCGCN